MKLSIRLAVAASLALAPFRLFAANWWEEMDYGRFLSASFIDNVPTKITARGVSAWTPRAQLAAATAIPKPSTFVLIVRPRICPSSFREKGWRWPWSMWLGKLPRLAHRSRSPS